MPELNFSDMDSYLNSLAKRIASLEVQSEELKNELEEDDRRMHKFAKDFKSDLADMRSEAKEVRREIVELSHSLNNLIGEFKSVARKSTLGRLQRKVDEWDPESLATHKKLRKEIDKFK